MSFKYSSSSAAKLGTCDQRLQRVFAEVIKHRDCTILCGTRGREEQEEAVRNGTSKVHYPNSKHNTFPSLAVDAVPCPIAWGDRERMALFAGFVQGIALGMGIKLRIGADFNGDGYTKDDGWDMPHFEIVE